MNTLFFTGILIEDAKAILSTAYEWDKAATFVNGLHLHGSNLDARATKNDEKSAGSKLTWWDVAIKSDNLSEQTLKEIFSKHVHAFSVK